ncbi:OLC1v1022008C1 [Oldenlandia corymbosa var. corymbosa]|uniref:OLC1v1022008C1 n=1 Tax=Oldenlandia corymbosa var. corymbosa TaxID=529605 RepID=A0AAV1BXJ0_OLDCO|nr:OLC1v1022008C1 [Oldenlandia corymbosa var. corymbosa]
MEYSTVHPSTWNSYFTSPLLFPYHFIPENYVHWTETPESHIYSADLPGVKKEEIRVEVEDSKYLIIRTEAIGGANEESSTEPPARSFMRKFRLPDRVDINGISAGYEDGVLTVKVPRSLVRRGFFIQAGDIPERMPILARAA